jgi:hypothetical protein
MSKPRSRNECSFLSSSFAIFSGLAGLLPGNSGSRAFFATPDRTLGVATSGPALRGAPGSPISTLVQAPALVAFTLDDTFHCIRLVVARSASLSTVLTLPAFTKNGETRAKKVTTFRWAFYRLF